VSLFRRRQRIRRQDIVDHPNCQVAEHCWDPVGHAMATYGDLFDGLIQAGQREV
jgi:hypothetical protein